MTEAVQSHGKWRYLLQRLNLDGTGEFLHTDLPLVGVEITEQLSGPNRLTGTIPVEIGALKDAQGRPLFDPWATAIYAESDGQIRGGGILTNRDANGPALQLDCAGFWHHAEGQPYVDSNFWVQVDPLDMARHIWEHLQSQPLGNLGLALDATTSPVRIGTELQQVQFDTQSGPVSFEAGPYRLAWYETFDLGKEFTTLAENTPFEFVEEHKWNELRTDVLHQLHLGYPRLGTRRRDLTFVYGENIFVTPDIPINGEHYANGVMVLGAGEGRDMIRSNIISRGDGRLRRIAVVTDKTIRSIAGANSRARNELAFRQILEGDVTEVTIRNHPHAPLGAWTVGDEVYVKGDTGWDHVGAWFRILTSTLRPEVPDVATLTIERTDRAVT